MFIPFWTAVGLAALFYFLIPLVGAFKVRYDWRKFRSTVSLLSLEPVLKYVGLAGKADGRIGRFRLHGLLDAYEGRTRLWIRGGGVTVTVDLEAADLFSLPGETPRGEGPTEGLIEPERLSPSRIRLLPEQTKVWVGGPLYRARDSLEFKADETGRPLVIFYECEEASLFLRCIWSGRHRNEYWNSLTPVSLSLGFSLMAILLAGLFGKPVIPLVWIMTLLVAIIPLLPFLPPGIFGTWAYGELWKKACVLRSDRDFFRAPLRFFRKLSIAKTQLPDGSSYERVELSAAGVDGSGKLPEGIRFITDSDGIAQRLKSPLITVFGARGDGGEIRHPDDFMADFVAIPGEPEKLAVACARKARFYEILSGFALLAGVTMNATWIWMALRRFF